MNVKWKWPPAKNEPIFLLKSAIFLPAIFLKFVYYSQDSAHENNFFAYKNHFLSYIWLFILACQYKIRLSNWTVTLKVKHMVKFAIKLYY